VPLREIPGSEPNFPPCSAPLRKTGREGSIPNDSAIRTPVVVHFKGSRFVVPASAGISDRLKPGLQTQNYHDPGSGSVCPVGRLLAGAIRARASSRPTAIPQTDPLPRPEPPCNRPKAAHGSRSCSLIGSHPIVSRQWPVRKFPSLVCCPPSLRGCSGFDPWLECAAASRERRSLVNPPSKQ